MGGAIVTAAQLRDAYFTWLAVYFTTPEPARWNIIEWHCAYFAARLAQMGEGTARP